ncbi:MAG: hypothetical protein ABRQ37_18740 [Candidatus Eremiobacterota bacterium]
MEIHDKISLKEINQKALKSFLLWREKKQEQEEEEETDLSSVNILLPDYHMGSRPF